MHACYTRIQTGAQKYIFSYFFNRIPVPKTQNFGERGEGDVHGVVQRVGQFFQSFLPRLIKWISIASCFGIHSRLIEGNFLFLPTDIPIASWELVEGLLDRTLVQVVHELLAAFEDRDLVDACKMPSRRSISETQHEYRDWKRAVSVADSLCFQ